VISSVLYAAGGAVLGGGVLLDALP
jgi:hypothetical protein